MDAVARRLAGVTAAVDGFAERQQDLLSRDYSEDLALIHQSYDDLRATIDSLATKAALVLTPEVIVGQIERLRARKDTDAAMAAAQNNLQKATSALARMTDSVRTAKRQNQWRAGAAGLALVLGWIGGGIIPPAIDWVVPASWQWPEKRAMSALRLSGWGAGERLLFVNDLERWNAIRAGASLSEASSGAIRRCARRAVDRKLKSVGCSIEVNATD